MDEGTTAPAMESTGVGVEEGASSPPGQELAAAGSTNFIRQVEMIDADDGPPPPAAAGIINEDDVERKQKATGRVEQTSPRMLQIQM